MNDTDIQDITGRVGVRIGDTTVYADLKDWKAGRSFESNPHKKRLISYGGGKQGGSLQVWVEDGAYKNRRGNWVDRTGKVIIGTGMGWYPLRPEQIDALVEALKLGKNLAEKHNKEVKMHATSIEDE